MAYNLGYVGTAYNLGYTGTYTGGTTYPYILTSHGTADPNSIMADANFASTDPVDIRIISDFDPAKVEFDWQAFSDSQLWRDDVSTLAAVTVNATSDTTDSATIGWRTSDGTEGQFTATVNLTVDTTPAQFTFNDQTGVALNTVVESNAIVVSDVVDGATIPVSVTGGEYAVSTDSGATYGAYTATSGSVQLGDRIKVRHTSSASNSTATNTVLDVGGITDTFTTTTVAAVDTTPAQFTFTDQAGVEPGSVGESNAITISDVDAGEDIPVTVTGGEYAVDAGAGFGAFTTTGTNVQLGYQIKVRNTASSEFETTANTTLDAGGTTDTFTRTTRAAVLPTLDTPLPDLSLGQNDAVSVDLANYFSGASSFALSGIPAGSGLSFSGSVLSGTTNTDDIAASPYSLTAIAYSADGSIQDAFSVTVVDDIAPVISVFSQTTTNTAPIVSGSAGDAVSLTLVVTGVGTYNPTPLNGSWTQQLPTVALGEYAMTLNGTDAAGNPAVEATGTLSVVDEIITQGGGLFRPLFRPTGKALFRNLFR